MRLQHMSYTLETDHVVQRYIQKNLDTAVQMILQRLERPPVAILLCGGFGRGEGTVFKDGQDVTPVNDYDFLIVTDESTPRPAMLGKEIAKAIAMKLVDIGFMNLDELTRLAPSQWGHDLKYGSRVIFGDDSLLQRLPNCSADQIPIWDGIKLLCNRMAGIIGAYYEEPSCQSAPERMRWMTVQVDHILIACGDAFLITSKLYHNRYSTRVELLNEKQPLWFTQNEVATIVDAYKRKLSIWDKEFVIREHLLDKTLSHICPIVEKAYIQSMQEYLGRHLSSLEEAIRGYFNVRSFLPYRRFKRWLASTLRGRKYYGFECIPAFPVDTCYTLMPLLYFSAPWQAQESTKQKLAQLVSHYADARICDVNSGYHKRMSKELYAFWEQYCH
ncbi:hypothetical protein MYX04_03765 [Nitrospiraceae bacterium AH_259_D15_M11_P09]|nr:hypothetical protein [Nitrospiraceae bacterium AH_259_D15_M11_P09]